MCASVVHALHWYMNWTWISCYIRKRNQYFQLDVKCKHILCSLSSACYVAHARLWFMIQHDYTFKSHWNALRSVTEASIFLPAIRQLQSASIIGGLERRWNDSDSRTIEYSDWLGHQFVKTNPTKPPILKIRECYIAPRMLYKWNPNRLNGSLVLEMLRLQ